MDEETVDRVIEKARLALAVAVITSRPPGQSGREHAEALARRLTEQDEGWKCKAQELQEEVLKLRQELLLAKMMSKIRNPAEPRGPALQPAPAPAPAPSSTSFPSWQGGARGRAALLHMRFLQSWCGLHRAEGKDGGLEGAWFGPDGDTSVLADSVCQLLDWVAAAAAACKTDPTLPSGAPFLLLQACQVAGRAVDLWGSHGQPSAEFVTRVEERLKELTRLLLCGDELNRFQLGERLTDCLVVLGASKLLKTLLIRHILSQINNLAHQLCQGQETAGPERFTVHRYENSFYLFWILEQLLQRSEVPGREQMGSGVTPEQKAFQGLLGHHVLLLSDEFPLFALYMWRIGALLSP
ncbi:meiosis-specific protein MEI4 [Polymixia lowei]